MNIPAVILGAVAALEGGVIWFVRSQLVATIKADRATLMTWFESRFAWLAYVGEVVLSHR